MEPFGLYSVDVGYRLNHVILCAYFYIPLYISHYIIFNAIRDIG